MSMPVKFIDGRTYPSLTDAAKDFGISTPALCKRLDKWQFPFSDIMPDRDRQKCKPCYFRGKRYSSRLAAAAANSVPLEQVYRDIKRINSMA